MSDDKGEENPEETTQEGEEATPAPPEVNSEGKDEEAVATAAGGDASGDGGRPDFTGTWKAYKNDNMEAFLYAIGANFFLRKIASKVNPTMEISHEEPQFSFKVKTGFVTQSTEFKIGEPYEFSMPFGEKQECISEWEGQKLVTKGKPVDPKSKAPEETSVRELVDGDFVMTLSTKDVRAKRYFKRVK